MSLDTSKRRVVERIYQENWNRFSSPEGRASLRVIDLTFDQNWIYLLELLQNAADAGARRIAIDSTDQGLTFQHDGKEPLTEGSVKGMAGLFQSTKGVRTVGFMGIGIKSVFQRWCNLSVSGFGWSFRFTVEVETGVVFGDCQPKLIGTVLPIWDESVPPPNNGFTTRFGLDRPLESDLHSLTDLQKALPPDDRTVLALLAHRGIGEIRVDTTTWILDVLREADSLLVVAQNGDEDSRWRLFPVNYVPSKAAIARLLERRRILPSATDRDRVYAEAERPRQVIGVLPVGVDDVPHPPLRARAYALLPTASELPFGLHVNADWLVTISRRGLPDLEDNQWQNEIIDGIANVVAAFLRWLIGRHGEDSKALSNGYEVLRVPTEADEGGIAERVGSAEWRARLQELIREERILPGYEDKLIRLRSATETVLLPGVFGAICGDPEAHPAKLFQGPVIDPGILTRTGVAFIEWLGLVDVVTPAVLGKRWPRGPDQWWNNLDDESVKRRTLLRLWAGFSHLAASDPAWNLVRSVPTSAGGWVKPGQIQYLTEAQPSKDETCGPEVADFIKPHLPASAVRPPSGLIEAMRSTASGADWQVTKAALDWFEKLAKPKLLAQIIDSAVNAWLTSESSDTDALIQLAQWAMSRNRTDLVKYLVVVTPDETDVRLTQEALLAEPYVEHGSARRRLWPGAGVVCPEYVETDPESRDGRVWRDFLEKLGVLGPVRIETKTQYASRRDKERVALFLETEIHSVIESNNHGYMLHDFDFQLPLARVVPDAIAGWLEEGYTALKGKERRQAHFSYNGRQVIRGTRVASWVVLLRELPWVPCEDGELRTPAEVLMTADPAREDYPVSRLSAGLMHALQEAGIQFGTLIPKAPILRQLRAIAGSHSGDELAAAILEGIRHIADESGDREQFEEILRELPLPRRDGKACSFERLVRAEGPGVRSGLGGWVTPLSALEESLSAVLMDHRFPLEVPTRTTGHQALAFLKEIWNQAEAGALGLAQAGDYLPFAYAYVLDDMTEDPILAGSWEEAKQSAYVFTRHRRWVPVQGEPKPRIADIDDSLVRRFLSEDYSIATSGHFGSTAKDQLRVADALRVQRLSDTISIQPIFYSRLSQPDWQLRFSDLLKVLAATRAQPEHAAASLGIQSYQHVVLKIQGVARHVGAYLLDSILYVTGEPRRFSVDAASYLVEAFGLTQQAQIASFLTSLLGALDEPALFADLLQRLAKEFVPEFEISTLSSIEDSTRATPPGIVQHKGNVIDEEEAERTQNERVKTEVQRLLSSYPLGGGDDHNMPPGGGADITITGYVTTQATLYPTAEQQSRGAQGEAELLNRLKRDGGYLGFCLLKDCRRDGCGYDFLCLSSENGEQFEVELKTFAKNGGIHFTSREVKQASTSRARYVLIGLLDDGGDATGWEAIRLDDPYPKILESARPRGSLEFTAQADAIFNIDGS